MVGLIQRVVEAKVSVDQKMIAQIGPGLVVMLGMGKNDTHQKADHLANRILHYRIFDDEAGRMNRSIQDIGGQLLIISQFTLVADVAKGTRPSFAPAAVPSLAEELYQRFIDQITASGITAKTGRFGARMLVSIHNDGPVTFLLKT